MSACLLMPSLASAGNCQFETYTLLIDFVPVSTMRPAENGTVAFRWDSRGDDLHAHLATVIGKYEPCDCRCAFTVSATGPVAGVYTITASNPRQVP